VNNQIVVGVALFRDGLVLAAYRPPGAGSVGGWEFPGGKVEPGETDETAAARELREELGIEAVIGPRLGPDVPISDRFLLRVYAAELVAGEPHPHEHTELRWFGPADLAESAWLAPDRPILSIVRRFLVR